MVKQNGYLILEHLSNIELYYTAQEFKQGNQLILTDDEFHHSVNVMRNSLGDILYVTDGEGIIYKTEIASIGKKQLSVLILEKKYFVNKSENICFCIPMLKNQDRLKYIFEKCVELGITKFILFSSKHTISKKNNLEKFKKTTHAAMKQSIRAFLSEISVSSFNEIIKMDGVKLLFDQNAEKKFDGKLDFNKPTYLLFGPEGGFDENELGSSEPKKHFSLSTHRLRSETAIVKCASLLNLS
jgi:16S rRNA (uracil1498-N3)-methyltransferase